MKIIKWNTLPEGEEVSILTPASEGQKQVIFDIIENKRERDLRNDFESEILFLKDTVGIEIDESIKIDDKVLNLLVHISSKKQYFDLLFDYYGEKINCLDDLLGTDNNKYNMSDSFSMNLLLFDFENLLFLKENKLLTEYKIFFNYLTKGSKNIDEGSIESNLSFFRKENNFHIVGIDKIIDFEGANLELFLKLNKEIYTTGSSHKLIQFFAKKSIIKNITDLDILLNKRKLFINVRDELFIKNYDYLEKSFGRKLMIEDFNDDYFPNFIKYADTDNFDFLIKEIQKKGGTNPNFNSLIKNFHSRENKGSNEIDFRQIYSFIIQPGLAKKIEYFYEKNGENFNIYKYFNNSGEYYNYKDISSVGNNLFEFYEEHKGKENNINIFKNNTDNLLKNYKDLTFNNQIFNLLERNYENVLLLEKNGFDFKIEELTKKEFINFLNLFNLEQLGYLLKKFKSDIKNIEDLLLFKFFSNLNISGFESMFTNKFDFSLLKNSNFIAFIKESTNDFGEIQKLYNNTEEIKKVFSDKVQFSDIKIIAEKYNEYFFNGKENILSIFRRLEKKFNCIDYKELKNIGYENFLFNVKSKGGKLFDELLNDMKKSPNENLYDIMQKNVVKKYEEIIGNSYNKYSEEERKENQLRILKHQKQYYSNDDIELGNKLGIDKNKLRLSIYLRYGHTVDFPEIAEYIILFYNYYFEKGNSKYFKDIGIVPRLKGVFPDEGLFKGRNIKQYSVQGTQEYQIAMYYNSVGKHLSHSEDSNNSPFKTPQNITGSMELNNNDDTKSKIELEHSFRDNELLNNLEVSLEDIISESFGDLISLESNLDKI